jgi:hypothetical protein
VALLAPSGYDAPREESPNMGVRTPLVYRCANHKSVHRQTRNVNAGGAYLMLTSNNNVSGVIKFPAIISFMNSVNVGNQGYW